MDETAAATRLPWRWLRLLHRHCVPIVLGIALLATFVSIGNHELWLPDEPREAEIGREMLLSGPTAVPHLSGEPFVEKPPLFAWAIAASYAAFGVSPAAARVPAALASTLAAFLAFLLARRLGGPVAGVAAAVVLLTTTKFMGTSSAAVNDTALTAFVAGGHLSLLAARDAPRRVGPLLAAGVWASLAFLTKGLIGPILIAAPVVVALAALREFPVLRTLVPRALLWCGVPVLVTVAGWSIAAAAEQGGDWGVVQECLVNNTLGRALGDSAPGAPRDYGHSQSFWYYLTSFPVGLLPWSLAIPALLRSRILRADRRAGRARFLAVLVVAGIVLLSLPSGKRSVYFMPLVPAAAAVFGVWVSRIGSRSGSPRDRATTAVQASALALAGLLAAIAFCGAGVVGVPRPELAPLLASGAPALVALGTGGAVVAVLATLLAVRLWRNFGWRPVRAGLALGVAALVGGTAFGRAVLDPLEQMRDGAERVAELVPAAHAIAGLDLGETERAVISYYSRRPFTNIENAKELSAALRAGRVQELVVSADRKRDARHDVLARFDLVERVELRPGDFVDVYRLRTQQGR